MYIGWDTTTPDEIPPNPQVVLPYNSGTWNWAGEARHRFPHAIVQEISVRADVPGSFLDIEQGDASADQFVAWHTLSVRAGFWRPGFYCNKSTLPSVDLDAIHAHLARADYRKWIADPTGQPHIEDDWDGCQCIWKALGRNLDESVFRHEAIPGPTVKADWYDRAVIERDTKTGIWKVYPLAGDRGGVGAQHG